MAVLTKIEGSGAQAGNVSGSVSTSPQALTLEQQFHARQNIDAFSATQVLNSLKTNIVDRSDPQQVPNMRSLGINEVETVGVINSSKVMSRDYKGGDGVAVALDDATSSNIDVRCGNQVDSWGTVGFAYAPNTFPALTGSHISCASNITLAGVLATKMNASTTGVNRLTVGGANNIASAPPQTNDDAITDNGWGFEMLIINGVNSLRLFAHDGTTYRQSASIANPFTDLHGTAFVLHKQGGNLFLWTAPNGQRVDTTGIPDITLIGLPTTGFTRGDYFTLSSSADGTNDPIECRANMKPDFKIAQNLIL